LAIGRTFFHQLLQKVGRRGGSEIEGRSPAEILSKKTGDGSSQGFRRTMTRERNSVRRGDEVKQKKTAIGGFKGK